MFQIIPDLSFKSEKSNSQNIRLNSSKLKVPSLSESKTPNNLDASVWVTLESTAVMNI